MKEKCIFKERVILKWRPKFAYAIGLLVSDGCLSKDGRHIILTSNDVEQLNTFNDCLGLSIKIGQKYSGTGNMSYYIQFSDVYFYRYLQDIGLMPAKSKILSEIKIPKEYFIDGLESGVKNEIEKSLQTLKNLGAELVDISLPHTQYGLAVYYIIMPAEVTTNMARYDGIRYGKTAEDGHDIAVNRGTFIGKEVQRRIMLGSFVLSSGFYDAYYKKASLVRELVKKDFTDAFEKCDVIVTPTAPSVAWKIGEKVDDPLKMYLSDIFTVNGSLAGLPGLTVPCGFAAPTDDVNIELPVGLQILGPQLGEEQIFLVGHVFEQANKEYINSKKPKIG